jgi:iron complex outermembrane receptor protein
VPATLLGALPAGLRPALTGRSNLYALEFLQSLVTPSIKPGSTYFQAGQGIDDYYKMKQNSYSLFGQADYKVTDKLTLTGGLAYLNDDKKARSNVVLQRPVLGAEPAGRAAVPGPGPAGQRLSARWAACSSSTATPRPTVRSTSRTPPSPAS